MKFFDRQSGPLTKDEFEKFDAQRKRVILGVILIFSLAGLLAINQKLFHSNPPLAAVFLVAGPIMIWTLIQMLKFKCPRCGTTPMGKRVSLIGGGIEVGSYVALRPKKCHQCGVLFEPPKQNVIPAPPVISASESDL